MSIQIDRSKGIQTLETKSGDCVCSPVFGRRSEDGAVRPCLVANPLYCKLVEIVERVCDLFVCELGVGLCVARVE